MNITCYFLFRRLLGNHLLHFLFFLSPLLLLIFLYFVFSLFFFYFWMILFVQFVLKNRLIPIFYFLFILKLFIDIEFFDFPSSSVLSSCLFSWIIFLFFGRVLFKSWLYRFFCFFDGVIFFQIYEEMRMTLALSFFLKNILLEFMRIEHIFLFFFNFVFPLLLFLDGLDLILFFFLLEELLVTIYINSLLLLRALGLALIWSITI